MQLVDVLRLQVVRVDGAELLTRVPEQDHVLAGVTLVHNLSSTPDTCTQDHVQTRVTEQDHVLACAILVHNLSSTPDTFTQQHVLARVPEQDHVSDINLKGSRYQKLGEPRAHSVFPFA